MSSDRRTHRFAAIVPVGRTAIDLCRGVAVIESLCRWEPATLTWCVIVDDAPGERGIAVLANVPATCQTVTLLNPRRGSGGDWRGAVTAGLLAAFSWIDANTDADFALKIDTDALAIAPFADAIAAFLADSPGAGIIGALGVSCNPVYRAKQNLKREPDTLRARRLWPSASSVDTDYAQEFEDFGVVTRDHLLAFDRIRPIVDAAVAHGYATSEYCQGGAVAFSRTFIGRMSAAGYLSDPKPWIRLPFWGDLNIAMFVRAVDLHVEDCSQPGQPFGIQYLGLPYPPEELVARGYSLIHSVKNDRRFSETAIRHFFTQRAQMR